MLGARTYWHHPHTQGQSHPNISLSVANPPTWWTLYVALQDKKSKWLENDGGGEFNYDIL
jgi:hypothetical protein